MRRATAAVGLLAAACGGPAVPSLSPTPPTFGFVILTSAGAPLADGSDDVTPTLDLRVHAGAPATSATAQLDGRALPLHDESGDALASVAAMPLGSAHQLSVALPGRDPLTVAFHVVGATGVMAAVHLDSGQPVADVVFERAPDGQAVATALGPGAVPDWTDPTHLRVTWSTAPPAALTLPAGIAAARGSATAAAVSLPLGNLSAGQLRRVTVPAATAAPRLRVTAYVVGTAASHASLQANVGSISVIAPTGWRLGAGGSLIGSPDASAVAVAQQSGRELRPLLADTPGEGSLTSSFLADSSAQQQLIGAVVSGARQLGAAAVELDFEALTGADRDHYTAFAGALAGALHAAGLRLAVDVVPHKASGGTQYSAGFDPPALAKVADALVLLTYDEHTSGSSPGPVAGLDWQAEEVSGTLAGTIPTTQALVGLPLYGRAWGDSGNTTDGYTGLVTAALAVSGAAVGYDFAAATPFISGGGTTTWFDDADSTLRKLDQAGAEGVAGVAMWRLGFEDPAVWQVIPAAS